MTAPDNPLADLKVRREIYALLGKMGVFDEPALCRCGCNALEHVPVRHGDGPWQTVCRNCSCREYEEKP